MDIILNIEYSGFLKKTTRFHEKYLVKGQLISKANCQAVNSSKKQTNEFIFTSMQCVFVRFLEEIEDSKKTFRNYLTFSSSLGCIMYIRVNSRFEFQIGHRN